MPDEAVSRMTILKMWTNWASEYVMKENKIGSLEVGKLADLLILDRDYFTIPIDEIPQHRAADDRGGWRGQVLGRRSRPEPGHGACRVSIPGWLQPLGKLQFASEGASFSTGPGNGAGFFLLSTTP